MRPPAALAAGLVALALCVLLSLMTGQRDIGPGAILDAILDPLPLDPDHDTVRSVRIPRTYLAIVLGAALAVAGALTQSLTRNPLADPGILGVTAGASLAVVLAQILLDAPGGTLLMVAACGGAAVAMGLVSLVGRGDPLRLVLAGVALGSVLAGVALGIRLVDADAFDAYRFWSVGSLAGREQLPLLAPSVAIGVALVAALVVSRPLDAIALGEDVAHGLGVPVLRTRLLTLLIVTVLAGVATAVAGPIAFAGLIVPHLARAFAGGSIPWLVGLCVVGGGVLMVASDTLGRVLLPRGDVPVAIVVAAVGGPVLVMVVRRTVVTR